MKFALFCCVVWIALYSYYLEQNRADCGCSGKPSPEKQLKKNFTAFLKDFQKYCKANKLKPECHLTVLMRLHEIQEKYKRVLANSYVKKKALAAANGKNPMANLLAAKDALYDTILNKLDDALRVMNFRELKLYNLKFKTLFDLFLSVFLREDVENIDGALRNTIEIAYGGLKREAGTDERAFLKDLEPDEDVKVGLALYFIDLLGEYSGEKLTKEVIHSYKEEVRRFAILCLPEKARDLVGLISEYKQKSFFKDSAQKEKYVNHDELKNLSDVDRRTKIYRAFIQNFATTVYDEISKIHEMVRDQYERDVIAKYDEVYKSKATSV